MLHSFYDWKLALGVLFWKSTGFFMLVSVSGFGPARSALCCLTRLVSVSVKNRTVAYSPRSRVESSFWRFWWGSQTATFSSGAPEKPVADVPDGIQQLAGLWGRAHKETKLICWCLAVITQSTAEADGSGWKIKVIRMHHLGILNVCTTLCQSHRVGTDGEIFQ